jgi:hypothetical protein
MIDALHQSSRKQQTLHAWYSPTKAKATQSCLADSGPDDKSGTSRQTAETRLKQLVIEKIGAWYSIVHEAGCILKRRFLRCLY